MKKIPAAKLFLVLLMISCARQEGKKDWKLVESAETLMLYSNGNYAGSVTHRVTVNSESAVIISETRLQVETSGLSDSEISNMMLIERRMYGFDGALFFADQQLSSSAGSNKWKLVKEKQEGWTLTVTVGGTMQTKKIAKLSENLNMTYDFYSGVKKRTARTGDVFHDSVMDLTSGKVALTTVTCKETPSLKNGFRWVFITDNNLTARGERWELDTNGVTVFQEMWPFVARKTTGNGEKAAGHRLAAALFETLAIPAPRAAKTGENVVIVLDSLMIPDTSVSRFYEKAGKAWIVRNCDAACPEKQSTASPDTGMRKFIEPTTTMQSADLRIVKIADSLVRGRKDRCDSIAACCEWVSRTLKKQYTPTFSSALETLKAGFGDCGEHAVLLGALLRAVRVPARVVLGLVYAESRKGYVYHAWIAASTGASTDAWLFADPSLGVFPATRDRVPLVIDDTGGEVVGILKIIGRIKIEYVKK